MIVNHNGYLIVPGRGGGFDVTDKDGNCKGMAESLEQAIVRVDEITDAQAEKPSLIERLQDWFATEWFSRE